jgi:hypothetical protein
MHHVVVAYVHVITDKAFNYVLRLRERRAGSLRREGPDGVGNLQLVFF